MAMSAGVARKASCGPGFARSSITDGAPPPVVWQVDGDLDGALCLLWRGFGWRLVDAEQFRAAFHEALHFECAQLVGVACDLLGRCLHRSANEFGYSRHRDAKLFGDDREGLPLYAQFERTLAARCSDGFSRAAALHLNSGTLTDSRLQGSAHPRRTARAHRMRQKALPSFRAARLALDIR